MRAPVGDPGYNGEDSASFTVFRIGWYLYRDGGEGSPPVTLEGLVLDDLVSRIFVSQPTDEQGVE